MFDIERHILSNGMHVVALVDDSTPITTVNLLYKVGSRNENPDRTGLAHFMEHLMFTGSENAPDFDQELQCVGGENNAFTDDDITNYYINLPVQNIETAFWLESDRMNNLLLTPEAVEVQRKVVMEEFKQRCLNQPYGDLAHLKSALAYKVHPYQWPTIGKELSHIENASIDEIKNFYHRHYTPDNAILSVVGNIDPQKVFQLAEKWFSHITSHSNVALVPQEPKQIERRTLSVERNVPADVISINYHMGNRLSREFYVLDMATDILSDGVSSRLVQALTKQNPIMSDVDAGVSCNYDAGLLSFNGTLLPGVTMQMAEDAIHQIVNKFIFEGATEYEMQKVKNRSEASRTLAAILPQIKARELAYYEMLGNANMINTDIDIYNTITSTEICEILKKVMIPENESVIYYHTKY